MPAGRPSLRHAGSDFLLLSVRWGGRSVWFPRLGGPFPSAWLLGAALSVAPVSPHSGAPWSPTCRPCSSGLAY